MSEVSPADRERIDADPYCATLGIELASIEPGRAVTRLTIDDGLLNFHGTAHGGAIYSLADAAFAAASNALGETALALETNVSYLEGVETGTTLEARATEIHRTRRTASYEVVVVAVGDSSADGDDANHVATFRGRVYRP